MSSYLLDTEFLHTKAIIIIGVGFYLAITVVSNYVVCGQVEIASNLICLHLVSSANLIASLWIMATMECYNAWSSITTMVCLLRHCRVQCKR